MGQKRVSLSQPAGVTHNVWLIVYKCHCVVEKFKNVIKNKRISTNSTFKRSEPVVAENLRVKKQI